MRNLLRGLNILDIVTTLVMVCTGWGFEGNPIMAWCLVHGVLFFILVKLALAEVICLYAGAARRLLWIPVVLLGVAVVNNVCGMVLIWTLLRGTLRAG